MQNVLLRIFKPLIVGILVGVEALLGPGISTLVHTAHASDGATSCRGADVEVSQLLLFSSSMHGTLCLPSGSKPSTVMVLVPGWTYNHTYWDFPYKPEIYNFREAMNRAGYATFVVDRIGTGESSHPLSALLTESLQAKAVHGVIQALRSGEIGGVPFSKVIVGGHSAGSAIAIIEASSYKDVDGVVLTGYSHHLKQVNHLLNASRLFLSFYPATLDPQLGETTGLDVGYLTTRPGTRAGDFYKPATADPQVIATDEANKDVLGTLEAPDALGFSVVLNLTRLIDAPVLIANGQADDYLCEARFCATSTDFRDSEEPYFSRAACLQAYLLPGSGHSLNLATDTPKYQKQVASWADSFVGSGEGRPSLPPGAWPT